VEGVTSVEAVPDTEDEVSVDSVMVVVVEVDVEVVLGRVDSVMVAVVEVDVEVVPGTGDEAKGLRREDGEGVECLDGVEWWELWPGEEEARGDEVNPGGIGGDFSTVLGGGTRNGVTSSSAGSMT
jgi:hypothetical protein